MCYVQKDLSFTPRKHLNLKILLGFTYLFVLIYIRCSFCHVMNVLFCFPIDVFYLCESKDYSITYTHIQRNIFPIYDYLLFFYHHFETSGEKKSFSVCICGVDCKIEC